MRMPHQQLQPPFRCKANDAGAAASEAGSVQKARVLLAAAHMTPTTPCHSNHPSAQVLQSAARLACLRCTVTALASVKHGGSTRSSAQPAAAAVPAVPLPLGKPPACCGCAPAVTALTQPPSRTAHWHSRWRL